MSIFEIRERGPPGPLPRQEVFIIVPFGAALWL